MHGSRFYDASYIPSYAFNTERQSPWMEPSPGALIMQLTNMYHSILCTTLIRVWTVTLALSTGNFTLGQRIIFCLESLQGFLSVFCQFGSTISRHSIGEKSRFPFIILLFSFGCLLTLPFFKFCFQSRGFCKPFAFDRSRYC